MHFGIVTHKIQMINTIKNDKITKVINYGVSIMKKRFHLLIVIGILLVGFVVGSFLDLQINKALFSKDNGFGLFMASFGVYPCYMGFAFAGGGLLITSMKRKDFPLWAKIICYAVSGIVYGLGIYLCGKDMPSVNGYNNPDLKIPSFCIAALVLAGAFAGGFFVCRNKDVVKLWPILVIMLVIFTFALLPAGFLIKLVIHRPRFRLYMQDASIPFCNWWESFKEYKEYIAANPAFTKEEFKSFPSGHSGTGMILAMFLPMMAYFFPKLKKYQTALFYGGVAWGLVMMFSRMLCGAHYLTDVCAGSLIVMIVYYIVNEFAIRKGLYEEKNQEEAVPALE